MASSKSARRSRKRRSSAKGPRAVPSRRRERAVTRSAAPREPARSSALGYGERPLGPFGGVPVSELAILAGIVATVVGYLRHGPSGSLTEWVRHAPASLIVGVVVCFLGVLELTAREHFSGYRSHATLLAGLVAVALETVLGVLVVPQAGALLLIAVVPAFAGTFVLLRRRFKVARQARVRAFPLA